MTGAGKHFAAGADITELENTSLADMAATVHRLQSSLGALAGIAGSMAAPSKSKSNAAKAKAKK